MKKNPNDNPSKIMLTLVVALIVFYYFFHNNYLLLGSLLLGLIGVFSDYLSAIISFVWMWLAEFMGKYMSKIMLTLVYIFFFTPLALIHKLFKKNQMSIKKSAQSQYIERNHLFVASDIENPW